MATAKQEPSSPRVLGVEPTRSRRRPGAYDAAWRCLGWIGAAFVVVGGMDLVLTWIPLDFGSMEWEFGTVTATLDGLPVPALGLVLLLAAGLATGRRWLVRGASAALAIMALLIVASAVVYATTIPVALSSVPDDPVRLGVQKAVVKTSIQAVVYPLVFVWIGIWAWRHSTSLNH